MDMPITDPQRSTSTGKQNRDSGWRRYLHATAVEAVRRAGRIQQQYVEGFKTVDVEQHHDLKLAVDRQCEAVMVQLLRERFPDHGIISEESAEINPEAAYRWYIDPLDGTVNYYLGQPYFCACAACYHLPPDSRDPAHDPWAHPLSGVVYAPMLNRCFEAMPDGPAICNGRPVQVGSDRQLQRAVVGFSYGSDPDTMRRMQALGAELVRQARKVRIFGATALDLVHVASGRLSGLVQGCVRGWDFAAARIIVEAAGGYFRADRTGPDQWQIVGAAPGIAGQLQALVDRHPV